MQDRYRAHDAASEDAVDEHDPPTIEAVEQVTREKPAHQNGRRRQKGEETQQLGGTRRVVDVPDEGDVGHGIADRRQREAHPERAEVRNSQDGAEADYTAHVRCCLTGQRYASAPIPTNATM